MGDLTEVEGHDMMTAEMVGLPLAFIVLLLAQRSVLAAMMPMVLGMCAVGVTLGFTGNWNWWIPRRLGRLLPNSITDELPNAFYHVTGSSFIP